MQTQNNFDYRSHQRINLLSSLLCKEGTRLGYMYSESKVSTILHVRGTYTQINSSLLIVIKALCDLCDVKVPDFNQNNKIIKPISATLKSSYGILLFHKAQI